MRPIAFGFKKVRKSDSLFLAIGTFMHSLDRGIHRFDAAHLTESSKDIFAGEGRGETRVLIITCSDIGIDPFTLFGDNLVKLAVLQRAGNTVERFDLAEPTSSGTRFKLRLCPGSPARRSLAGTAVRRPTKRPPRSSAPPPASRPQRHGRKTAAMDRSGVYFSADTCCADARGGGGVPAWLTRYGPLIHRAWLSTGNGPARSVSARAVRMAVLDEIGRDLPSLLQDSGFRERARKFEIPPWTEPDDPAATLPQLRCAMCGWDFSRRRTSTRSASRR